MPDDRYLVISSDCHAGLPNEQYREWLDPEFRETFDKALADRARMLELATRGILNEEFAEEWHRALLAALHRRRGEVVVFDRHFFADYFAYDIAAKPRRTASRRLHGFILSRLYPKPDLVIYLDAPPEVLFERKGEGTVESLERRRREYLELGKVLKGFAVVDASRSVEAVTRDVAAEIEAYSRGRATVGAGVGS